MPRAGLQQEIQTRQRIEVSPKSRARRRLDGRGLAAVARVAVESSADYAIATELRAAAIAAGIAAAAVNAATVDGGTATAAERRDSKSPHHVAIATPSRLARFAAANVRECDGCVSDASNAGHPGRTEWPRRRAKDDGGSQPIEAHHRRVPNAVRRAEVGDRELRAQHRGVGSPDPIGRRQHNDRRRGANHAVAGSAHADAYHRCCRTERAAVRRTGDRSATGDAATAIADRKQQQHRANAHQTGRTRKT